MSESTNIGKGKLYMDGRLVGNIAGIDKEVNKIKNTVTVGIEMVGYKKMKQQLRNLEATYDRILEKQKLIDKGSKQMYDADEWKRTMADGRWVKDHELLQRIDTDCGRIVRKLGCDKIQHSNNGSIYIDGVRCFVDNNY
ncbi:hypothetical protein [Clostridium tagluense]|uniref:Uncharacterized protein n=1 Tax=Clostridium tagluense TaxID=360422 RepID=A0A401UUF3_9CLOT|nr:hypothetical protein [Clostridium tagluense]GCD13182.1 hypothetical protein Ctaglu_48050 [Clostridium tagluense]